MKRGTLSSVCILVIFIWGCPKRQATNRIVYIPPSPPAPSSSPREETGALVIEEPQVAEPEEESLPVEEPPAPKPPAKRHPRPARPEIGNDATAEPEPVLPAVEFPALEPRESPRQQTAQRQQIAGLQNAVRARIGRLERSNLSSDERRMLVDARTFLAQSERALAASDFQRALTLARKASMLAAVLEQE